MRAFIVNYLARHLLAQQQERINALESALDEEKFSHQQAQENHKRELCRRLATEEAIAEGTNVYQVTGYTNTSAGNVRISAFVSAPSKEGAIRQVAPQKPEMGSQHYVAHPILILNGVKEDYTAKDHINGMVDGFVEAMQS